MNLVVEKKRKKTEEIFALSLLENKKLHLLCPVTS